jgi:hypothetical protein
MGSKNANKQKQQKLDTSNNSRLNTGTNTISPINNLNSTANINSEFIDKESQSRKLNDILEKIDIEIKAIKQGKSPMQLKKVSSNKEDNIDALLKRTYYLTELMVFVRWTMKAHALRQMLSSLQSWHACTAIGILKKTWAAGWLATVW